MPSVKCELERTDGAFVSCKLVYFTAQYCNESVGSTARSARTALLYEQHDR